MRNSAGTRQGWANSIAADMVVRATVAAGHAADQDRQLADARQGVQGEQGVHVWPEAGAVDQGQRADPLRVGQGQTQRDHATGGVSDHVQRRLDAEGVEEAGHERGQVAAGAVPADRRGGVAVAGQAQGQHPMGAGERGNDPPPAGGALLVTVQQQQRRSGPGLQELGVHPVHGDPTVANSELAPILGFGCDEADVELACVERTDNGASWCAVCVGMAASPGAGATCETGRWGLSRGRSDLRAPN